MQFRCVIVEASIDGIEKRGNLIRKDFDWNVFRLNVAEIRKRCPKILLSFGITVSIFNILTLVQLLEALEKECGAAPSSFWTHSLQGPTFYRTQALPKELKKEAGRRIDRYVKSNAHRTDWQVFLPRLRGLVDYMNAEDRSSELPRFREVTGRVDSVRNESLQSVLPELTRIWTAAENRRAWWPDKLQSAISNIREKLKI